MCEFTIFYVHFELLIRPTEEHYNKRRILEAVEIEKHPNNFNRDDGLVLSDLWKPLIRKLRNNEELSIDS